MGLCANPNNPCPVGPVFMHHLQAYPSGWWTCHFFWQNQQSKEHISLSNNLWLENVEVSPSGFQLITRSIIPLQAFLIITFNLSLTTFSLCPPRDAANLSRTFTMRGWGIGNSLISLPLASIGSNQVQQSLSPGTLVLTAEHIGLMATQATGFNRNRVRIAQRCQSWLISKPNTYSLF